MEMSNSSSIFLFSVYVFIVFSSTGSGIKLPGNNTIPAVIVFGDSIVDTGNNNNLRTLTKCNFPPYGQDFMGGMPTGRFCNGKVPSDLIAEELGIKEVLPAYLDPNLQPEDLVTGVVFASGGCGYDPLTSTLESAITLPDQLKEFNEYTQKLKQIVGEERTYRVLNEGLFVVVASSNDIANAYYNTHIRQLQYNINTYTGLLVTSASNFLKDLYGLGVRRVGVFGAPPVGCLPSSRTLGGGGIRKDCVPNYNQASQLFNTKLSAELNSLNSNLPNAKFVYFDIYNPLLDIIQNPQNYGFEIVKKGCCGTGTVEASILCNSLTATTCANVSAYVFWDGFHPTERVYTILVSQLLRKYINNFF